MLPGAVERVRRRPAAAGDGDRRMIGIGILATVSSSGLAAVETA